MEGQFGAAADTSIQTLTPENNWGADDQLRVGASAPAQVTLLRFDLASIPTTAVVTAAELHVWVSIDALEQGSVQVHRVLEAWDEGVEVDSPGAANWMDRGAGVPWTSPGAGEPGSRDGTVLASFVPNVIGAELSGELPVAVVQDWVATPGANHGLAFAVTGTSTQHGQFQSRESVNVDQRPYLKVVYQP
jgi:hypothetical protein